MDIVWPKLVVEENNLLVHMVALRKLLGPQAIATIPGRGYRFTMPVEEVANANSNDAMQAGDVPRAAALSPAVRGNLPTSPELIGRAQDLDAIAALMLGHAVVSIVGAGGIGKTRMALAVANSVTSEFPDGRWWVELAPVYEGCTDRWQHRRRLLVSSCLPAGAPTKRLRYCWRERVCCSR